MCTESQSQPHCNHSVAELLHAVEQRLAALEARADNVSLIPARQTEASSGDEVPGVVSLVAHLPKGGQCFKGEADAAVQTNCQDNATQGVQTDPDGACCVGSQTDGFDPDVHDDADDHDDDEDHDDAAINHVDRECVEQSIVSTLADDDEDADERGNQIVERKATDPDFHDDADDLGDEDHEDAADYHVDQVCVC